MWVAASDGFLNGYQTFGIERQLEDGIRGFLIDVYFGFDEGNIVVTDRAPVSEEERELLVADIGESAVAAAEATRAAFEAEGVAADLYLCHALCEIGAAPLVPELERIKAEIEEGKQANRSAQLVPGQLTMTVIRQIYRFRLAERGED